MITVLHTKNYEKRSGKTTINVRNYCTLRMLCSQLLISYFIKFSSVFALFCFVLFLLFTCINVYIVWWIFIEFHFILLCLGLIFIRIKTFVFKMDFEFNSWGLKMGFKKCVLFCLAGVCEKLFSYVYSIHGRWISYRILWSRYRKVGLNGIWAQVHWIPFRRSNRLSYQALSSTHFHSQLCTATTISSFLQCQISCRPLPPSVATYILSEIFLR